jgi:hypothetical protein
VIGFIYFESVIQSSKLEYMYEYENEPTPSKNTPLIKLYGLLCAILSSLPQDINKRTLTDGSGQKLNGYIDQIVSMTSDPSLNDFKVETFYLNGKPRTSGEGYARQVSSLAHYLFSTNNIINYYCAPPPELKYPMLNDSNATTVNNHLQADQQVNQSTNVQIDFTQTIVNLTEALTKFECEHPDESSKENKFAKSFKKKLPSIKNTLEITALALKIASEIGIDPSTALKALGMH